MGRSEKRRIALHAPGRVVQQAILLFVVFAVWSGCREELPTVVPEHIKLRFSPGDYFAYENWDLDEYGFRIQNSLFRSSWTVHDTGFHGGSFGSSTLIIDSIFSTVAVDTLVRVDSVLLRIDSNGDIYQFGFVEGLIRRKEGREVPRGWDRIAAFSGGFNTSWVVGWADSVGGEPVLGTVTNNRRAVAVSVNGVNTVVLAYDIIITSQRLYVTLRIGDSPSAFLGFRDESVYGANGVLQEVRQVRSSAGQVRGSF